MKAKGPLGVALAAGVIGASLLTAWFAKYWPASSWRVLPRTELIAKGRQIARHFGVDTTDWKAHAVPSVSQSLAYYRVAHPDDVKARTVSPLSVRIPLSHSKQTTEVGLDSAGLPLYFKAPKGYKPPQKFDSDDAAADSAFQWIAGSRAAEFEDRLRSMGDDDHEEEYTWKKQAAPNSDLRERIKVTTNRAVIKSVERKAYRSSEDDDSDAGDGAGYWSILSSLFGILCSIGAVVIIGFYILWLVRRAVSHRFPIRISITVLVIMGAAVWFGNAGEKMHALDDAGNPGSILGVLFVAAMTLCITAVGRGISVTARPKWISLEQLFFLAPISKSTGESLFAGLLCSPLLAAIPFLIAACGLFPHAWVLPRNAELLYSRAPVLDSIYTSPGAYLLGFFGFGLPALERLIGPRWLRWTLVSLVGVAFFADVTRVVSGPLAAPLAAGVLTLALFWFIYARFDLLAVLTLQISSALLLTALMLLQKNGSSWGSVTVLVGLLAAAFWLQMRGRDVAEGDPLASHPALSGFRAEREKLKAEFSVARRAQQDMLPRTPPVIPGYTLAASCTPSLDVGGDLYDFLKLPDGRIGIGVADVSGKGVPAALYMTLTKGLLASVAKNTADLSSMMGEVNRHLHGVTRKKVFVTMALGFLDSEKRVLECVRAGHNPMVWRQASQDATTLVSPGGLGLGITAGRVFGAQLKVEEMALSDGDAVVFYSDGITEAMNSELEQFGEQRLMDAVRKADRLDAAQTHDSILGEVREFLDGVHPQDDMTLVVLRVGASN